MQIASPPREHASFKFSDSHHAPYLSQITRFSSHIIPTKHNEECVYKMTNVEKLKFRNKYVKHCNQGQLKVFIM